MAVLVEERVGGHLEAGNEARYNSAGEKLDFSHGKVPGSCLKVEASPLGCGASDGGELGDECFSVGVGTLRHSHSWFACFLFSPSG